MSVSFDNALANSGIVRAPTGNAAIQSTGSATLDQASFLKLMTEQLKNQDPFKPVENEAMIAQMAQFSSVAGISEMNTTLKAMAAKLSGSTASDALGYVGKTVLVEGGTAYPHAGGGVTASVELGAPATNVNITISSASGEILKTLALGATPAGATEFEWDGSTDAGTPAGAGPFKITATANDGKSAVTAKTLVWAPVSSVTMPTDGTPPKLTVAGLGQISSTAVREIG